MSYRTPLFGVMFCCCPLEILNNFIFDLEFYKWSLEGYGTCKWSGETGTVSSLWTLATPFAHHVCCAPWFWWTLHARVFPWFWWTLHAWVFPWFWWTQHAWDFPAPGVCVMEAATAIDCWHNVCIWGGEINMIEFILCSVFTVLVRMKYIWMYEL